ncbi:MAG: class I SAM-dependent methyltransferase [Chitinophagales bacterium]
MSPFIRFLRKGYRYTYKWIFSKYDVMIEMRTRDCTSILDVGCGANSPLKTFNKGKYCVGIDAFAPSIEKSKAAHIHKEYIQADVLSVDTVVKPGAFDAVLALDLIEHLTKEDGYALLDKLDTVAGKKIFIYTPNGFLPQGDRENNPWQVHHSGWSPADFIQRGYKVYGVNGVKPLRGEFAKVKWKPAILWNFISDLTEPFVKNDPDKAFQLLAVKTISKK